jgi:hypothetical protein
MWISFRDSRLKIERLVSTCKLLAQVISAIQLEHRRAYVESRSATVMHLLEFCNLFPTSRLWDGYWREIMTARRRHPPRACNSFNSNHLGNRNVPQISINLSFRHNWGPAGLKSPAAFGFESVPYVCRITFETLVKKTCHQLAIKTRPFSCCFEVFESGKAR